MNFNKEEIITLVIIGGIGCVTLFLGQWAIGLLVFLFMAMFASGTSIYRKLTNVEEPECIIEKEDDIGWEVVNTIECDKMNSSEIPNGFVVSNLEGKPALIDFDENGEPQMDNHTELSFNDWLKTLLIDGRFACDVFVLVHTVKGAEQMLVKSLEISRMTKNGEPISVGDVAQLGVLPRFARTIRAEYMKKMEAKCENTVEKTDG